MENTNTDYRKLSTKLRRISAGSFALALAAMQVTPAYATVDNTVTASGTAPGGVPVSGTATATVGMEVAGPAITVSKVASFNTGDDLDSDGKADLGDKITYIYTVTNTGNVTVNDVAIADAHDGLGSAPVIVAPTSVFFDGGPASSAASGPAGTLGDSNDTANTTDNHWSKLGPGDVIKFESSYIVVAADITGAGGGTGTGLSTLAEPDGYLDNTATATAAYTSGSTTTTVTATADANMQLDINNHITITKSASPSTSVAAGTSVTYTYVVTNDGNTPVSGINLVDTHKGVSGALTPAFSSFTTNTGSTMGTGPTANTITLLNPGDVAVFTATYIVTQDDVDNLQ